MSLDILKKEAAALDEAERRELLQFLVSLREAAWVARAKEATRRLNEPVGPVWLTLDEFKERLATLPEPTGE